MQNGEEYSIKNYEFNHQILQSIMSFKKKWKGSFSSKNSLQYQVACVLENTKWHCRNHGFVGIKSVHHAGGGGIQGLERGTGSREGLVLETKCEKCRTCKSVTKWDRWTGKYKRSQNAAGIPKKLIKKILNHYKFCDTIEQRKRPETKLIIDHRFPMIRWGRNERKNVVNMDAKEIEEKFQILKKDSSGNHNLLKSRDCERCFKTGIRGSPFGIKFYYNGNNKWKKSIPKKGDKAEKGCEGCGWYNFEKWRDGLNKKLSK